MSAKKYHVLLTAPEREQLARWSVSQKHSARERKHARILLLADEAPEGGTCTDADIAAQVKVCPLTVNRVRQRFATRGLQPAVLRKVQKKRKARLLDGADEAHLIALVCSAPPEGHKRWSLRLMKDTLIEQQVTDTVSHETVRQTLKKMSLNRG